MPDRSRIIAGTATLGKLHRAAAIEAMLEAIIRQGIQTLDTSPYYGAGCMETLVARALGRHPIVEVNTKFGLYPPLLIAGLRNFYFASKVTQKIAGRLIDTRVTVKDSKQWLAIAKKSLGTSLRVLKSRLDVFFAHEVPLAALSSDEFLGWIQTSKQQGHFKRFGLGGYRRQYESSDDAPLWNSVDVVQVESQFGQPLRMPSAWRGEIFLHGVLAPLGTGGFSDAGKPAPIARLVADAFEVQNANRLVIGFSREETLNGFLQQF
jgi:aryl-alcohol dehydrogenase-like predicted oxidoreductase